ncbi:MAG: L17 family ribosomal protein, partial [bacterium]
TIARSGLSFNAIRKVNALMPHREASEKLFEIAPAFKDRAGGYTQLFKTGFRRGDAAATVLLRFVPAEAGAPSALAKTGLGKKERKPDRKAKESRKATAKKGSKTKVAESAAG